jgi:acetylglutamate kinase
LGPSEKADVLIEALRWIREFRGHVTVIKLGGSLMDDEFRLAHLLLDVVFMESVGMRPVLVHGGGAAISRAMAAAGLEPRFVQGRRFTDQPALAIVEQVLAGEINEGLVRQIQQLGGCAGALNFRTTPVLFGEKIELRENGQPVDLGFVGEVTRVDHQKIRELYERGVVPVIPSMCIGADGQKYNVNADTAATAVAQALQAEKLVFLSDVNGVRRDKNDPNSLIHSLTAGEARGLIASGAVEAGMIPKVEACVETLAHGVRKIHVIDGRLRHSLLLEVYTSVGVGTEIIAD